MGKNNLYDVQNVKKKKNGEGEIKTTRNEWKCEKGASSKNS